MITMIKKYYILADFSWYIHTTQTTKKEIFERINEKMQSWWWDIRFWTEKDLKNFWFYIVKNN